MRARMALLNAWIGGVFRRPLRLKEDALWTRRVRPSTRCARCWPICRGPIANPSTAAALRQAQLTKPAGSLGRLEQLAIWLATWQARHPPRLDHPRTIVFAGNHGVAARGVSAYPASVTAQMVQNFVAGGAAVNQLCRVVDADLRVYEMNLEAPTGDIVERAGDERGGMRQGDGLRHDGGRARHRRAGGRRDGDRQYHGRRGLVRRAVRRRGRVVDRPRHRGRGGRARTQAPGRRRGRGTAPAGGPRPVRPAAPAGRAGTRGDRRGGDGGAARTGAGRARRFHLDRRRRRACSPPTRRRSTIASSPMSRPNPATAFCSNGWVSGRCSISACGSARPRGRPWRSPF